MSELSHVDDTGKAIMVDISSKKRVKRTAHAEGRINLQSETVELIRKNLVQKGDVLTVSKIAGIMGAKKTGELIPLCHNIEIEHIRVELSLNDHGVYIEGIASCTDKTGIEMEALTAVSITALTVYDMCKAVDKTMEITGIKLLSKKKEEVEN